MSKFKAGPGPRVYLDNALMYGGGMILLISLTAKAATVFAYLGPALIAAAIVHIFYRALMNKFNVGL